MLARFVSLGGRSAHSAVKHQATQTGDALDHELTRSQHCQDHVGESRLRERDPRQMERTKRDPLATRVVPFGDRFQQATDRKETET